MVDEWPLWLRGNAMRLLTPDPPRPKNLVCAGCCNATTTTTTMIELLMRVWTAAKQTLRPHPPPRLPPVPDTWSALENGYRTEWWVFVVL